MFFFLLSVKASFFNIDPSLDCVFSASFPFCLILLFRELHSRPRRAPGTGFVQTHCYSIFLCFKEPDHVPRFPDLLQEVSSLLLVIV